MTENVTEHNDLPLQQLEPITEEHGQNITNAGFNHQKIDVQNVETPKDAKNGVKDNASEDKKLKISYKNNADEQDEIEFFCLISAQVSLL